MGFSSFCRILSLTPSLWVWVCLSLMFLWCFSENGSQPWASWSHCCISAFVRTSSAWWHFFKRRRRRSKIACLWIPSYLDVFHFKICFKQSSNPGFVWLDSPTGFISCWNLGRSYTGLKSCGIFCSVLLDRYHAGTLLYLKTYRNWNLFCQPVFLVYPHAFMVISIISVSSLQHLCTPPASCRYTPTARFSFLHKDYALTITLCNYYSL